MAAIQEAERPGDRSLFGLFVGTGLALFALMGVLGLLMRFTQADVLAISPGWFYRIMTLHGAGMLVAALLAQMGALWFVLRGTVDLSVKRVLISYATVVGGALLVLGAVLLGGFATGWTFLSPLPFRSAGEWGDGATAAYLVGLVLVGVGFQVYCIDVLSKLTERFGGLARTLGLRFLTGREDEAPPPQAIAGAVVALDGLLSSAIGVVVLVALLARLIDPSIEIDALWAKNATYFFGHSYANLIIYLAAGAVYVVLPRYAGRPWKTTKPIVIAWLATLTFVATAYSHHLYMDFVQPQWAQIVSTTSSFAASIPVAVVTVFTGMMLVWGSRYRWTLASTLIYLGFMGWAIGGTGAVIDSLIPANFRLHNTLWVPAHFHTYLMLGVMLWVMAFAAHLLERAAGQVASRAARIAAPLFMVVGGYGLVGAWYVSGALGVPRRYAVHPGGSEDYSLVAGLFLGVFSIGFLILLAEFLRLGRIALYHRRERRAGPSLTPAPIAGGAGSAIAAPGGRATGARYVEPPCRTPFQIAVAIVVAAVGSLALLPFVVEASEASVKWHHTDHAALFLAGAFAALAIFSLRRYARHVTGLDSTVALLTVILAPAVAMLAMTPKFYSPLEDSVAFHFSYHVLFVVLGFATGAAATRLGRVTAWTVVLLSCGMGFVYAAGVSGG